MEFYKSTSNPFVQKLKSLKDKKARRSLGYFLVEGENIIKDFSPFVDVKYIVVEDTKLDQYKYILGKYSNRCVGVDSKVMKAISDTVTPCGIVAVVGYTPSNQLVGDNIVVLDGVTDPGNFGTIVRSCVACGIKDVLAVESTDFLSGKVVRASMGGVLRCNIVECTRQEMPSYLEGRQVYALDMNGENIFENSVDKTRPWALVVGSEAHGISPEIKLRADNILSLPMVGDIESLNAGVSLSVGLFELVFGK